MSFGQKHDTHTVRGTKLGCFETVPEPSSSHLNNMGKMIGETVMIGIRRILINILYLNNSDVSTIYGTPFGHFQTKF